MKITFVLARLDPGGAEKVLILLANHLAISHQIEIIVKDNSGVLYESIDKRISIISPKHSSPWSLTLPYQLLKSKPDIIFSTFWDINCLVVLTKTLFLPTTKIIIRDSVSPIAHIKNEKRRFIGALAYRHLYPRSDIIITLSNELSKEVELVCDKQLKQLRVIRNPQPATKTKTNNRTKKHSDITLISLGRLVKQKGFDLLIHAVSKLTPTTPTIKLKLVGDGPELKNLKELSKKLEIENNVEFISARKETSSLLREADIYILSSRYEGVSNAMLEAMSENLPIVATTLHTSASEYITHEENGILISETNTESLTTGIKKAIRICKESKWSSHHSNQTPNDMLAEYIEAINSLEKQTD